MGLDGISINQLRAVPEKNSAELNSNIRFNDPSIKPVDGLSQDQRVNPDKQDEHQNQYSSFFDENEEDDDQENSDAQQEITIKYDLSQSEKYILKSVDETNEILIIEKSSDNIVQKINAQEMSAFVNYMAGPKGAIVNRKF